jgi:predicted AAA+ superfamily ATPase
VFLHWRRQREDLAYIGGEREIDLVVNVERPQVLINVALSVAQANTWEREVAALEWAGQRAPKAKRTLIVQETADRELPSGIEMAEAWRYLLGARKL